MPRSDLKVLDLPVFGTEKVRSQSTINRSILHEYRTVFLKRNQNGIFVPCRKLDSERSIQVHAHYISGLVYTVVRVVINIETDESSVVKLATFSRKLWARQFIVFGRLPCEGICMHAGECKQKHGKFANTAENLTHVYYALGKNQIFSLGDPLKV
jgi:hypothetical protein